MSVIWGYCKVCNKEIEVRGGVLLPHLEAYQGPRCAGSGRPPTTPPGEGVWKPVRRPATPVPEPGPGGAAALRTWRDVIRGIRW